MKPDDAARIFNRLERTILVDVASRMKPVKIGAVLAAMEPSKAQDLTVMLAKRMRLSQLTPVVPPVAAPAPPAPVEPAAEAGTLEAPAALPAEDKPAAEAAPQRFSDQHQHFIHAVNNLVIGKTQDAVPLRFEECRAECILLQFISS